MTPIDHSVSPGIGGFLAFFLLACALWLLMRSMLGHLHSVRFREEREEEAERDRQRREGEDGQSPVQTRPGSLGRAYPDSDVEG